MGSQGLLEWCEAEHRRASGRRDEIAPDVDGENAKLRQFYIGRAGALLEVIHRLRRDDSPGMPPGQAAGPVAPVVAQEAEEKKRGPGPEGTLIGAPPARDEDEEDGMSKREHGSYEVVDGVPTIWVRCGGPDGPLRPVRRAPPVAAAAPAVAIHDCRGLAVGSKISIITKGGDLVIVTIERSREDDADEMGIRERLVTDGGTLRWYFDDVSWWRRQLPGCPLTAVDVVSVQPYPAPQAPTPPSTWLPPGASEPEPACGSTGPCDPGCRPCDARDVEERSGDPSFVDDLCTWDGPDVDPLVGCIEPGVRVMAGEFLCPHHIAATLRAREEYAPDEALNVALGLHEEGIAGEALGLTDAQVEQALRGTELASIEPEPAERLRARLFGGGT
jgi:hypothetical protein